jgi:hypothetical protein
VLEKYVMIRPMTILRRWRLALAGALLLVSADAGAQLLPGGRPLPLPSGPSLPRVARPCAAK